MRNSEKDRNKLKIMKSAPSLELQIKYTREVNITIEGRN